MEESIERELLVSLLISTKGELTARGNLRSVTRVSREGLDRFLEQLNLQGLIVERGALIEISPIQRLRIAVKAIELGADIEKVCRALGWMEFEDMASYIFNENSYRVRRRFRFQAEGRRWEIDVLAIKEPLVVCAECKHWSKPLGDSTARKVAEEHLEKVRVLSENSVKIDEKLDLYGKLTFIPLVLSLRPNPKNLYRRIPFVSVFKLPSFLSEFDGQIDWLSKFKVELPPPRAKPSQTSLRLFRETLS